MEAIPAFVLPMWGGAIVALIISLGIVLGARPHPEPRGAMAFLLPFAIPTALVCIIILIVSGIGSLLILAHAILNAGAHMEGEITPGSGAAIAIALILTLVVLLGSAVLASRPEDQARH